MRLWQLLFLLHRRQLALQLLQLMLLVEALLVLVDVVVGVGRLEGWYVAWRRLLLGSPPLLVN